jgi:DNA-binding MarR family transcriptional regulator
LLASPAVPDDQDRRAIGFLIADVARLMRASFDRRVRQLGLTRAQWLVLVRLARRPGMTQSELAESLEVERATAGRMVDRLERKAWVERRADTADRRVNRLYLTAEAEAVQARVANLGGDLVDEALVPLAEAERLALAALLERVKVQLHGMAPRAEPLP